MIFRFTNFSPMEIQLRHYIFFLTIYNRFSKKENVFVVVVVVVVQIQFLLKLDDDRDGEDK